jgi:prevent-host-death family protein
MLPLLSVVEAPTFAAEAGRVQDDVSKEVAMSRAGKKIVAGARKALAFTHGERKRFVVHDEALIRSEVSVSELKSRLSEYLRAAQAGRVVTVVSHGRPVARLVPAADAQPTRIRKAQRPWGFTRTSRTGSGKTDSIALLLDERRRDRR